MCIVPGSIQKTFSKSGGAKRLELAVGEKERLFPDLDRVSAAGVASEVTQENQNGRLLFPKGLEQDRLERSKLWSGLFQNFLCSGSMTGSIVLQMVFETDSVQTFLSHEFSRRVRFNPRYSLRAYARALGLSSGALSEILRSRRPLSLKAATRIARSLSLNAAETKRLYELVEADKRKALGETEPLRKPDPRPEQKQLDEDTFHLVSGWQHFAILNLVDCEGFQWNASYIAKRLGLGIQQAKMAMELLVRIGLVRRQGTHVKCDQDAVLSPSGVPSAAVRAYHRQIMEKAIQALELQDIEEREMTGIGFAVDPSRLPQIKREISEFQDQLVSKYSKGKRHDVYFLETALFRLTTGERDENN